MIVTDMCALIHAWVIALEYQFLYEKWAKYHILIIMFQYIDQIAINNVRQLLYISLHVQ